MTTKFECDFCGANCIDMIEASRLDGAQPGKHTVGICHRCGELLMIGRFSVRKPTEDEYLVLGTDSNTAMARRVWLESKASHRPRSRTLTQIDEMIDGLPKNNDRDNVAIVRGSMLCGAFATISEVKQLLERCDSYDEFFVALTLLEADIAAERDRIISNPPQIQATGRQT